MVLCAALALGRTAAAAEPTTAECTAANSASSALRDEHRLRDARAQLLVCASPTCPEDVRVECGKRLEIVDAATPTIVLQAKDPSGADVEGVSVSMDGRPLVDRLDGAAIPVDPGEHRFVFTAAGRSVVGATFVLREGEKERREHVVLAATVAPAAVSDPPETPRAGPEASPSSPAVAAAPRGDVRKDVGVVISVVGLVGVGLGAFFGLGAVSTWTRARSECNVTTCRDHAGAVADRSAASTAATASTISFVAAGIALAGGLYLILTAPGSRATGREMTAAPTGGLAASWGLR